MPPLYALMISNVYFLQIEQKKSTILSTSHFSDFISFELFKFLQTSLWVLLIIFNTQKYSVAIATIMILTLRI